MNFDKDPVANAADRVYGLLQSPGVEEAFKEKLQHSISVIEQSLQKYG